MAQTSNALLRYLTLDSCLRDTEHKYSLSELMAECEKATSSAVSERTLQLDLKYLRDKQEGYGAPIVVYDHKYYKYAEPDFSIKNSSIKQESLSSLQEIAGILLQYSTLSGLKEIEKASAIINDVIGLPSSPKGGYFDIAKDATINRKVLNLSYFKPDSDAPARIIYYPLYIKEWEGRYWMIGVQDGAEENYLPVAIDTIVDYSYAVLPFPSSYTFTPKEYFKDIIGVFRPRLEAIEITFFVKAALLGYLTANPLHSSQTLVTKEERGSTFKIKIIPNSDFYDIIYRMQPLVSILTPIECRQKLTEYIKLKIKGIAGLQAPLPIKDRQKRRKQKTFSAPLPDLFGNSSF